MFFFKTRVKQNKINLDSEKIKKKNYDDKGGFEDEGGQRKLFTFGLAKKEDT